jgi:ornithine cyclodeaminase
MHPQNDTLRLLTGPQVDELLLGEEEKILTQVRSAYEAYANKEVALPKSTFLRLPGDPRNRIIALPAYLAENSYGLAGMKWISSIPMNSSRGLDRASSVLILNSVSTGRAIAVMEGSIISAKRTAASAALAARVLLQSRTPSEIGIIGCGAINFEICHFLQVTLHGYTTIYVFDVDPKVAACFAELLSPISPATKIICAPDTATVLRNASLVSIATTAAQPHLSSLTGGSVVLHISLRDIVPERLLTCVNVVDDIDHVCQHETSVHVLAQRVGHQRFISCTLGDLLVGRAHLGTDPGAVTVFSPFGLGILDLAVAKHAYNIALDKGIGTNTEMFFPPTWIERARRSRTAHGLEHVA